MLGKEICNAKNIPFPFDFCKAHTPSFLRIVDRNVSRKRKIIKHKKNNRSFRPSRKALIKWVVLSLVGS